MPRYARYKRYYKKVYPRKKWASNIKTNYKQVAVVTSGTSGTATDTICENSAPASTPTPVILKFARLKLKGDVRSPVATVANFTSANIFCCFVPEGVTLNADLLNKHPEYILGWTCLSMDSGNSFSLTTTLKRNLNSGDSIQLFFSVDCTQVPEATVPYNFYYTCQFWTTTA